MYADCGLNLCGHNVRYMLWSSVQMSMAICHRGLTVTLSAFPSNRIDTTFQSHCRSSSASYYCTVLFHIIIIR